MSDDDDEVQYVRQTKEKLIHYGSLEEKNLQKRGDSDEEEGTEGGKEDDDDGVEIVMEVSQPSAPASSSNVPSGETAQTHQKGLIEMFEKRKKVREMHAPTDDADVKSMLRTMDEPVCYFGEDAADRRQRLKELLVEIGDEGVAELKRLTVAKALPPPQQRHLDARGQAAAGDQQTWYHEGSQSLQTARLWIAHYSLPRAKIRLEKARQHEVSESQRIAKVQEVQTTCRTLSNSCSQIGDKRPLSYCSISPNDELLATASWSGLCKLWSLPSCQPVRTFRGHNHQVGCIVFHPDATLTLSDNACCLASCSTDGAVKLWNLVGEEPLAEIEGHAPHRVSRLGFHPSGRFLGTCCFDNSWRLWDLEEQEEILHQEGHNKPVYDIAFQTDGSLAATGGMDGFGRVWDLRTGRCIMFLEGHLNSILAVDFSPNGYHLATGSEDNSCRVWDLRQRRSLYTIPAHLNLVSTLKFDRKNGGMFLLTTSYDNTAKIWAHPGWAPLKTLSGHEGKVMCADIANNGKFIVTSSYDRTFKLWEPE